MACQTSVTLEGALTFAICTHDPDTGELTDTDFAPAYRVYEEETAEAILAGAMAKLDDANTIGFYTEQIACSAANGFERGKTYTVYIEATVDGVTGGISYAFMPAWLSKWAIAALSDVAVYTAALSDVAVYTAALSDVAVYTAAVDDRMEI